LPQTHWATDAKEPYYTYDPEKAKALMKEAGISSLKVTMPVSNSGLAPRLAQIVQAQVKDLGIEIELQPMAAAALPTRQQNGTDWHAAMQDFSAVIARSNPDLPALGQPNPGYGTWRGVYAAGTEAIPLLEQARQTTDRAKQKQLYADISKILFDASGFINLHRNVNLVPMRKDLMGYRPPVSQYDQFPELLWLQK
jgi:peptide/nickel transport system substrate-binding protein